MENSNIEWTQNTFNCWWGCTKVSDGCKFCYADTLDKRFGESHWGVSNPRKMMSDHYWNQPLKWNRDAEEKGVRTRVFCASMADVFEGRDTMPEESWADVEAARLRLFELIRLTPNLDWQLLTKRPENVMPLLKFTQDLAANTNPHSIGIVAWIELWRRGVPPSNIWMGTSVENQEQADKRIPPLLEIPARVRFLSCEPLLDKVDLGKWIYIGPPKNDDNGKIGTYSELDWVIAGGESGPNARAMNPTWARDIRDLCAAARVPFLFKQWGEWAETDVKAGGDLGGDLRKGIVRHIYYNREGDGRYKRGDAYMRKVGKKNAGRLLDGVTHDGLPLLK